jgi:hypothetical protein
MKQVFLIIVFFSIQFSAHAYEVLSYKTTVSPGCEGGVLSHTTTSSFRTPEELAQIIAAEENSNSMHEETGKPKIAD